MSNIYYDRSRKRVRQTLGTIYARNFEGEFGKVINDLMTEYGSFKKYLEEAVELTENGWSSQKYLDGDVKKNVKFDKLFLDWASTYDDEKELRVIGERDMDGCELLALENETTEQKEREKEQLRKLKQKYPEV